MASRLTAVALLLRVCGATLMCGSKGCSSTHANLSLVALLIRYEYCAAHKAAEGRLAGKERRLVMRWSSQQEWGRQCVHLACRGIRATGKKEVLCVRVCVRVCAMSSSKSKSLSSAGQTQPQRRRQRTDSVLS